MSSFKDDGSQIAVGTLNPVRLSDSLVLSAEEDTIFRELEKKNNVNVNLNETKVSEFLKCRKNPFYFIHNYMQIEEVGGMTLYAKERMNMKVRRYIKCLYKYHKGILLASRQLGKELSLNTPIPLPNGKWTIMGKLNIGDAIIDNCGNTTKVIAMSPIFTNHTCYKILFDSGEEITAGEEHLWTVSTELSGKNKTTVNTKELKTMTDNLEAPYIDVAKYIKNKKKQFRESPYDMGSLCLNLKKIPREYFSGSKNQRIQLLRGIMDLDGFCNATGNCFLINSNYSLIRDISELLSSLGVKNQITRNSKNYIINFSTRMFYIFNVKEKREQQKKYVSNIKDSRHYIVSIRKIKSVPCRCIEVDSPDKLYLCGKQFIPTHNSTITAGAIAHVMTFFPGTKVVIINMDMSAGTENINKIRFVLENLPPWMRFIPKKSQQHKTYIELLNGSKCQVIYPSTIN